MSLHVMRLTGQALTALPSDLAKLKDLQELYAGANKSHALLVADLAWNEIQFIPSNIIPLCLVSLNLSSNRLCNLQSTLTSVSQLPALRSLLLKGNPFCLQPGYTSAVQQQLTHLQHFDGNLVSWQLPAVLQSSTVPPTPANLGSKSPQPPTVTHTSPATTPKPGSPSPKPGSIACIAGTARTARSASKFESGGQGAEPDSIAAWQPSPLDGSNAPLQLQVQLSQLVVSSATPADSLPAVDSTAAEAQPPLYNYYLQLRTADGACAAGWPMLMAPKDELASWQARQAAESPGPGKKGAKKPAAAKSSKTDANASSQRKIWYDQGSLQANFLVAPDVATQSWLQSGMTIQLMRSAPTKTNSKGLNVEEPTAEASMNADKPCCLARGVVQAEALLDGVTRQCTMKLNLLTDVPLVNEAGIRLGLEDPSIQSKQEASLSVSLSLSQTTETGLQPLMSS